MACHIMEGILLLIFLLHHTEGRVDCADVEDCSDALVYEGCNTYPVNFQYIKNCPATCNVCSKTTHKCNKGYVEVEGHCETCQDTVLEGRSVSDVSCPQCPDVTKHRENCDVRCSMDCLKGCDRWSGKCHGCKGNPVTKAGRFGDKCEDNCPANCLKGTCQQDGGACSNGCKPDYDGPRCNKHSHIEL